MADEMRRVEKLLESYPCLRITKSEEGRCKVLCELTSHEMPCVLKAVESYINGKKFKYHSENRLTIKEQELCSEYLIPKRRGQLYCILTKKYINKLPHHIRLHLNGRRFQKALKSVDKSNSHGPNSSKPQEEITQADDGAKMWVPSDSESECEDNEETGSDFELDQCNGEKMDCSNEDYSFDILDSKESTAESPQENQNLNPSESKRRSEQKKVRKRSSKHLKEPLNELDKGEKTVKKRQEKKRKMT